MSVGTTGRVASKTWLVAAMPSALSSSHLPPCPGWGEVRWGGVDQTAGVSWREMRSPRHASGARAKDEGVRAVSSLATLDSINL